MHAPAAIKLEDARGEDRADGVAAKHAKEDDGHAAGELLLGVPCREGVDGAGDVARLAEAEDQAGREVAGAVLDEDLKRGRDAEGEYLGGDPFAGAELGRSVCLMVEGRDRRGEKLKVQGPTLCNAMLHGISNTTIPINIS